MAAQFRNLVFVGGGVKGIAYIGAIQVLSQRGLLDDVVRVGGTSAGAINALICALGYARALISAVMQVQENQHLHSDDWQRTLYINTLDVRTTDFDISNDKKAALIQEGTKGAENHFRWFESPAETPVNRLATAQSGPRI